MLQLRQVPPMTYGHFRPDIGKTRTKKMAYQNYGMAYQITEACIDEYARSTEAATKHVTDVEAAAP